MADAERDVALARGGDVESWLSVLIPRKRQLRRFPLAESVFAQSACENAPAESARREHSAPSLLASCFCREFRILHVVFADNLVEVIFFRRI